MIVPEKEKIIWQKHFAFDGREISMTAKRVGLEVGEEGCRT